MTRRELATVLALALGVAVLAAALAWIGRTALALETAQATALERAALEEKVRLSLWRMDSALTPFVGRENARPAERFTARARAPQGQPAAVEEIYRRLARQRFEIDPGKPATAGPAAALPLAAFAGVLDRTAALPEPPPLPRTAPAQPSGRPERQAVAQPPAALPNLPASPGQQSLISANQVLANSNEFDVRSNTRDQQIAFLPPPAPGPAPVRIETLFEPVWAGDRLFLVRRVRTSGEAARWQGVEVDWPLLRGFLLAGVRDLLPAADLRPAPQSGAVDPGRRLALLPIELAPGAAAAPPPAWTPLSTSLALNLGVIALVVVAAAILLGASLRQSRRRADFVSAVTHELRTPLTTFRLYADLLAEDRVPRDEQGGYLATLRDEAERLGHLVDNVLAFSRLERRSRRERLDVLPLGELLVGILPAITERAARSGLEVVLHPPGELAALPVRADPAAVERILQNLADNSAKYAREAADHRLELTARDRGRFVALAVADHGPGIPARERRRLFRPFHRPAAEAAGQAPGVGLGLSLSRRLARDLGGDLCLLTEAGAGAVFELRLRKGG